MQPLFTVWRSYFNKNLERTWRSTNPRITSIIVCRSWTQVSWSVGINVQSHNIVYLLTLHGLYPPYLYIDNPYFTMIVGAVSALYKSGREEMVGKLPREVTKLMFNCTSWYILWARVRNWELMQFKLIVYKLIRMFLVYWFSVSCRMYWVVHV